MIDQGRLDILLLIPVQAHEVMWLDPDWRRTRAPWIYTFEQARLELEAHLCRPLDSSYLRFSGQQIDHLAYRSLTAVVLATILEQGSFNWRIIDPGPLLLVRWRQALKGLSQRQPRAVGISTTYVTSQRWLSVFCYLVRQAFPGVPLIIGGQFYSTSPAAFLAMDADIYSMEEGEHCLPELLAAIRTGQHLEGIPGLYLRDSCGRLFHTGRARPVDLRSHSAPDWGLSARIEPPIDPERAPVYRGAQTQRGCAFKCAFCTVRKLGNLSRMDPDTAARTIYAAGRGARGILQLADSNASHPKGRWLALLEHLVALGGSPVPIRANIRASDIDDQTARLMSAAGVTDVRIGQESGDQGMLDAMRKGIKVGQLRPALQVLDRHALTADVSFILGYPGETAATLAATREMMLSLNEGFEQRPVVLCALAIVFEAQVFAEVARRAGLHQREGAFAYSGPVDANLAERERVTLALEMSRKESAPLTSLVVRHFPQLRYAMVTLPERRYEIFRWLKAVDRGVAIFLERSLFHKRPRASELAHLKGEILAAYDASTPAKSLGWQVASRQRRRVLSMFSAEWQREHRDGVGPLTRALLGAQTLRTTGKLSAAAGAVLAGQFPDLGQREEPPEERLERQRLARLAAEEPPQRRTKQR